MMGNKAPRAQPKDEPKAETKVERKDDAAADIDAFTYDFEQQDGVKIAILQIDSEKGEKEKERIEILAKYASECAKQEVKLLVLPELYITGYQKEYFKASAIEIPVDYSAGKDDKENPTHEILYKIGDICMRNSIDIICGVAEVKKKANDVCDYYNTALWMGHEGVIRSKYHKTHLWGEEERKSFTPPSIEETFTKNDVIEFHGIKIGLQICYDVEFVEGARYLASKGCDLIVVPTACPNVDYRIPKYVVPARAIENSCFVAYCNLPLPNWSGYSRICSPDGHFVSCSNCDDESLLIATINIKDEGLKEFQSNNNYFRDRRTDLYTVNVGSPDNPNYSF